MIQNPRTSDLGVTRDSHLSVANNLFGITFDFELDGRIHLSRNDIHFVQKNIKPRRLFIASNEDISTSFPPLSPSLKLQNIMTIYFLFFFIRFRPKK